MVDAAAMIPRPCPWHDEPYANLWQRVDSNLPHALLLTGETGTGKRRFAEAFAAALLCHAPHHGIACGNCKSCLLVMAGTHPDLLLVTPEALREGATESESDGEGSSRKKKPSAEIRVDDVRDVIAFAGQTAQFSGRRVVLIDPANTMNVNAANALLKTLEEPGAGLTLLLVTDAPASLPATIRSRCQRVRLPGPAPGQAQAWLAALVGSADKARELLAAAGNPTRALLLVDDDHWVTQRKTLAGLLVDALTGAASPVRFAESASKAKKVADEGATAGEPLLLDWLPTFLTDAVLLAEGAAPERLRNADLAPLLRRLVEARTTQPLFLLVDDIARMRQQMQSASGLNRQLLWEEVLLRWSPRQRAG